MKRWFTNVAAATVTLACAAAHAQNADTSALTSQVRALSEQVEQTQLQIQQSQRQLDELRRQLAAVQSQLANNHPLATAPSQPDSDTARLQEQQDVQAAEIATQEQTKIETASKYPFRLTGQLLFNTFVNVGGVDSPDAPTMAEPGPGSTGISVRQTMIGFDATGPHLFGATSFADARIDFFGNPQVSTGNYSGVYYGHPTLLRLRTAHAGIRWDGTEVAFSFDRPLLSPFAPSSLAAVAVPALAWSGNLWQWNPQLTVTHRSVFGAGRRFALAGALIDTQDTIMPPLSTSVYTARSLYTSLAEQSRWPGLEGRIAVASSENESKASSAGIAVYFAPHLLPDGTRYNAWAVAGDTRLRLPRSVEMTVAGFRGVGLGGLGAGTYKDFTFIPDPSQPGGYYYHPLDDVGGWTQLKKSFGQRLEANAAWGIDNAFADELPRYSVPLSYYYANLARNRTATGNIIYMPNAYLLFSLEYRHISSAPARGTANASSVLGLVAGYRF